MKCASVSGTAGALDELGVGVEEEGAGVPLLLLLLLGGGGSVSGQLNVAATKRAIARLDGPAILVGHSWGGTVITEAGIDPKVAGLVMTSPRPRGQEEISYR